MSRSLCLIAALHLLCSTVNAGFFFIDDTNATATANGGVGLDNYPDDPTTTTISGPYNADNGGGASYSNTTATCCRDEIHSGSGTAQGLSKAFTAPVSTPPFGTVANTLQAAASTNSQGFITFTSTKVEGSADPSLSEEFAPGSFQADHSASSFMQGDGFEAGGGPLIVIGRVYAAAESVCSATASSSASPASAGALCDIYQSTDTSSTASASAPGASAFASSFADADGNGSGMGQASAVGFSVTGSLDDLVVSASTSASSAGRIQVFLDGSPDGAFGMGTVQSQSRSVAKAYAWLAPAGSNITDGDNNFDNTLDGGDLNNLASMNSALAAVIAGPDEDPFSVFEGAEPIFDSNLDMRVSYGVSAPGIIETDSDYLVRVLLNTEYGDVDLDGDVDISDFGVLSANWNMPGGWQQGDFSGDGIVDFVDFSILSTYFGFVSSPALAVPEPTACLLILLGSSTLIAHRRSF